MHTNIRVFYFNAAKKWIVKREFQESWTPAQIEFLKRWGYQHRSEHSQSRELTLPHARP